MHLQQFDTKCAQSVLQAQQMESLKCRVSELPAAAAVACMSLKKYKYIMHTKVALVLCKPGNIGYTGET